MCISTYAFALLQLSYLAAPHSYHLCAVLQLACPAALFCSILLKLVSSLGCVCILHLCMLCCAGSRDEGWSCQRPGGTWLRSVGLRPSLPAEG